MEKEIQVNKKQLITKIVCFSLIFVVAVCLAVTLIIALKDKKEDKGNKTLNIDKMYIANYSDYSAIGVGNLSSQASSSISTVYASSGQTNRKLVGIKKDNTIEKIKFDKDENGEGEIEQENWCLSYFLPLENFSIASFCNYQTSVFNDNVLISNSNRSFDTFIIDNNTGRFYSLSNLDINGYLFYFSLFQNYKYESLESENALFLNIGIGQEYYIYKFSIENGDLKSEQIINSKLLEFNKFIMVDRYNNLFLSNSESAYDLKYNFVIKSNKTLERIDNLSLYKDNNGIVYTIDSAMKFDENGNLIGSSDVAENVYLSKHNLIKKVENVEYYYGYDQTWNFESITAYTPSLNYIYKLTWVDEINYSVEKIEISNLNFEKKNSYQYVVLTNRIYFLASNELFYVDIYTGERNTLSTSYIFNDISADNLGNVIFSAIDNGLNVITGIIKSDGTIDISVKESDFEVIYISPIN